MSKIRKKIVPSLGEESQPEEIGLSVADTAEVLVTSEAPEYPIHNLFDGRRGPGGTYWMASVPGDQTIILAFQQPQNIRRVTVEVEEASHSRTQEMTLAHSQDGKRYTEVLRQEYTFSPPETTFEREDWTISASNITHLRVWIRPDKGGKPAFATMTTLRLE
jgi:F5/8 type C domain